MYKGRAIIETDKRMRLKLDIAETNVSNKKRNATYKKKKENYQEGVQDEHDKKRKLLRRNEAKLSTCK